MKIWKKILIIDNDKNYEQQSIMIEVLVAIPLIITTNSICFSSQWKTAPAVKIP